MVAQNVLLRKIVESVGVFLVKAIRHQSAVGKHGRTRIEQRHLDKTNAEERQGAKKVARGTRKRRERFPLFRFFIPCS